MIRLDIFSDPVCPWCMIGKARLDRALERAAAHPFAIHWHPFQLNPDMPREGMDHRTFLEAKFGGQMDAARALASVTEAAEAAGVALNLDRIERMPNTLDAHRLIHWAGLEGRQAAIVSGLFTAHFRDGRNIGSHDVLEDIAGAGGMDTALVARLLASDADLEEIRTRDTHARARGITAVPSFIVADTHVVTGAQPTELWDQVIAELGPGGADN